jgi:elongator complex protein 1
MLTAEAGKLLPHLFMFSEEHREAGKNLQRDILRFQNEFRDMIDDVWTDPPPPLLAGDELATSDINTNGVDGSYRTRPPKPLIGAQNWTIRFWQ